MTKRTFLRRVAFMLVALASTIFSTSTIRANEPKELVAWNFNAEAEVKEWRSSNATQPKWENGALKGAPLGWDPFILSPHFKLLPKSGQFIEIRMKSKGYGNGEIFFASSDEGKYNGFSQDKSISWSIRHDGEYHTYQIIPAWLKEPQIIKIRVDLGVPSEQDIANGAFFEIDYIRILDLDLENAAPSDHYLWNENELKTLDRYDDDSSSKWVGEIGLIDPKSSGNNLFLKWSKAPDAPAPNPFPRASFSCITNQGEGKIELEIPLFNVSEAANKNVYSKNVDLSAIAGWGVPIYRWEISLPLGYDLKEFGFGSDAIGEGALEMQRGRQIAPPRFNEGEAVFEFETIIRNCGGKTLKSWRAASNSAAELKPLSISLKKINVDPLLGVNPSGDRLTTQRVDEEKSEATSAEFNEKREATWPTELSLEPGEAFRVQIKYRSTTPNSLDAVATLFANTDASNQTCIDVPVEYYILPEANLPQNVDYVPEPQPLESDYEIGALYFPGWSKRAGWDKIENAAPIRKPLLGYYDEGNPEVVDWQIKWAAENGIKFFLVDWYWYHGQVRLEHWIKAFQKARYRKHLKWAMMWANHTGLGTHSTEDWEVVTQYWIDHYFNTPEYYTIDGKPVVMIWDQSIVDNDMIAEAEKEGVHLKPGEGCKRALEICRKKCVEAGFKGVYFIAMKWPEHATDPNTVQKLADETFDMTSIYHFMYPGKEAANQKLYSFDQVVDASRPHWEGLYETGILPFLPNISTGWDSRPWHGFRSTVVYDRNIASFRRLLKDYKEFADATGVKRAVLGPLNEWGEGSYIEPNNEFGFGMYESIREALCKEPKDGFPVNYAPYEIGLGPYDLPKNETLRPEDHF